jgi:SulP family sulfate permease
MLGNLEIPRGIEIFEIHGPFFFGAADKLRDVMSVLKPPKVLIIRMRNVPTIDATGLLAFDQLIKNLRGHGTRVILCELSRALLKILIRARKVAEYGRENFLATVEEAIASGRESLDERKRGVGEWSLTRRPRKSD